MLLSEELYRKRVGLPVSVSSDKVSKHLIDMMSKSLGTSTVEVEVEVLGTVETSDLRLQVSIKAIKEEAMS